MTVSAAKLAECREKLKAGDRAAEKGGKVIALTVPMSFGVRLNFASGFVFDAMPDWEGVMALPQPRSSRCSGTPKGVPGSTPSPRAPPTRCWWWPTGPTR